jgi:hypothetical protein
MAVNSTAVAAQNAITDNEQFIRQISLVVVGNSGAGLDLSQLRIKFNVKHSESMTPNVADIRIYNLQADTAIQIRKEFTRVILQCGYPGNLGVIFQGNIKQVIIGRESATDTFIDLICGDGDRAYNFAIVNTTLKAGSTPMDQINAASTSMSSKGVSLGTPGTLPATSLPRAKAMFGNSRDVLRNVAQTTGQSWSIQNEKITFIPVKSYLPGTAVVLTSDTGMIGTPQQTNEGVNVKCLLNPLIRPGGRIKIDNASVLRLKLNLSDPNDPVNVAPPLSADGTYYVLLTSHEGDTRNPTWYTSIVGILIDITTNPINSVSTSYGS